MQNLTKGEMVYRVMMGILIIVAIYVPSISIYLLWALAAGMIISGIIKYCPVCQIINKPTTIEQPKERDEKNG